MTTGEYVGGRKIIILFKNDLVLLSVLHHLLNIPGDVEGGAGISLEFPGDILDTVARHGTFVARSGPACDLRHCLGREDL